MNGGARLRSALFLGGMAALALALLVFVGWGEAKRTYPGFIIDKMTAEAEIVRSAMDSHLRAGLPLRAYPGFGRIAAPILKTDSAVAAIIVRDAAGAPVFAAGPAAAALTGPGADRSDADWARVALPLQNRFEKVGELEVAMARADLTGPIDALFPRLAGLAGALALAFGVFAHRAAPRERAGGLASRIVGVYALIFVLAAAGVAAGLVSLYADGAQAKAKALSVSLGQRIAPLFAYGLTLDDVGGIDAMLADYRRADSDIAEVALMRGGRVVAHSDPELVGGPWRPAAGSYEYIVTVAAGQGDDAVSVGVALPAVVVWKAIGRSVKNFAALLLASGLFAAVFLNVARSFGRERGDADARVLLVMRPIFFAAIFTDFLSAGFLPQLLRDQAAAMGMGGSAASLAFTAYFVTFAAALMPATVWVERCGPRGAIIAGAALAAVASALPALALDFPVLVASRTLAGIGQGMLLIGVQTAVLTSATAQMRTRATAIIVIGFNGGMISGAAIGALLVEDLTPSGVFALSALVGLALSAYAAWMIPRMAPVGAGRAMSFAEFLRDAARVFGSLGFMRAFLLIGAPAKAVLTGVIVFAAPLFLSSQGWAAEDIGQIIMLYAVGVLLSTGPASRRVDMTGGSRGVLMLGGLGSAAGLAMIGCGGLWPLAPAAEAGLAAGGVFLIGLAHGCVNAPVVSFIGETSATDRLGRPAATAIYRLMERGGHVAGPMLVALLLAAAGGGAAFLWIAGALLIFTLLFGAGRAPRRSVEGG